MRIDGYTFQAANYCPDCILSVVAGEPIENVDAETGLDILATVRHIDRMDERSYDSGDFPKVIFSTQIEDVELCESCNNEL